MPTMRVPRPHRSRHPIGDLVSARSRDPLCGRYADPAGATRRLSRPARPAIYLDNHATTPVDGRPGALRETVFVIVISPS